MSALEINLPEVLAELAAVFSSYEAALVGNDVAILDALFLQAPHTIRYGSAENLHGIESIRAFRSARSPQGLARELRNTVITTFGRDFGTAMTEFWRPSFSQGQIGRQSQTWIRTTEAGFGGWRVCAAHVSIITRSD